jgi:hypothetical protein
MRRTVVHLLLALVAVAAAGCASSTGSGNSASGFQGEDKKVAQTVEDLQDAGSRGDQDTVCSDLLAKAVVDRLDARPGGCRAVVDAALKDTDTSNMTVKTVQVTGPRALARVALDVGDAPDEITPLQLVKEGGRWKISSFPGGDG